MVTDDQLSRTRRLALELAGIELLERHRELLARRSRRFGLHKAADWDTLLAAAEAGNDSAQYQVIALVTTGFTGFFRHPRHFEIAARHLTEAARRRGHARAWATAVASGEEAWSLAIAAAEAASREIAPAPALTLLATDINAAALDIARQGEYPAAALKALPPGQRERWFAPAGRGRWRIIDGLRPGVDFLRLNLARPPWPAAPPFDVILCRNVLMYLESGRKVAVLHGLAERLVPDGLLLLDPTEYPGRAEDVYAPVESGVYRLRTSGPRTNDSPPGRPAGMLTGSP